MAAAMGRFVCWAVVVPRLHQARRKTGRLFGRCELASIKVRPRIAPGPLLSKVHAPLERVSILLAAFRSGHAVGINVALTRWIRRVAFVSTAARARTRGHAFFMFRFLAWGSAGTDVSFTRRARHGLALSRGNKRWAEERRNDKSRDCKFGSHQNISVGYRIIPNLGQAIQFRRVAKIAQISFWLVRDRCANIRHFPNTAFAQSNSNGWLASRPNLKYAQPMEARNVSRSDQ